MEENPFKNKEKLAIKIEIATEKDWEACKDIRLEAITSEDADMFAITSEKVKKEQGKNENDWRKDLQRDDLFVVLSWNGSQAVGINLVLKKKEEVWHAEFGYVKKEFRSQGIHTKMLARDLSEIIKKGGKKVTGNVLADNVASLNVCEKFGFKKINDQLEKVVLESGTEHDFFRMELDLTNPEVIKKIDNVLNAG